MEIESIFYVLKYIHEYSESPSLQTSDKSKQKKKNRESYCIVGNTIFSSRKNSHCLLFSLRWDIQRDCGYTVQRKHSSTVLTQQHSESQPSHISVHEHLYPFSPAPTGQASHTAFHTSFLMEVFITVLSVAHCNCSYKSGYSTYTFF